MIEHDVPVTIDYVLEKTGLVKIGYVGHSQGTLVLFGLLSSNPAYNDKVMKVPGRNPSRLSALCGQAK